MILTTRYVACLPEAWIEALDAYRRAATSAAQADDPPPVAERSGSELIIRIDGIVLPTRVAGMRCAPIDEMLDALRDLREITAVTLIIDSPGGVAQSVDVLHARLMEVRADIPITAHVDGLCASAAYWIASAASRIVARPIAEVGGIGVYRVYYDRSEALREAGIRPVVIRSGGHKGVGLDAITDEQERVELENVMDVAREFERAVSAGRGLDPADVAILASGRTWVARRALAVGLIDEVDQADHGMSADDEEAQTMTQDMAMDAAAVAAEEPVATDTPAAAQAEAAGPEAEDQASAVAAAVEPAVEIEARVDAAAGSAEPVAAAVDVESAAGEQVDPVQAERDRVAVLLETFADDAAFAAACVRDGLSVEQAKVRWFDERRGSTAARATVEPVAPVVVPDAAESAREIVRRMAAEQGIPLSRAWAQYWRENNIVR